jgi:Outer membrane protein beta-barrel domain
MSESTRSSSRPGAFVGAIAGLVLAVATSSAVAQTDPGFSTNFSGGWSQIYTDGDSLLDESDGWYLDSDFAGRVAPALWLGLSFNGSYHSAEEDFGDFAEIEADLSLFAIEPRLRYVFQTSDDGPGLYVAPRIGAGLLIADIYAVTVADTPGGGFSAIGDYETELGFLVRPAIEVGFSGGPWAIGAEASYMVAWIDADAIGDTIEEFRAGFFIRFAY